MSVAVVTGAGRGLGRLIAGRLARRGLGVVCTDLDAAAAEQTAAELGPGALALAQDVRDPASHREVARAAAARGQVTVWVNNAGVLCTRPSWEHTEDEVRRLVEVNLLGVIWGSHAAVELMREHGGHIVNMGSMSSLVPAPGLGVYGATKQGVLGFSLALQGDLDAAGLPIRVSTLCPDAVDTEMVRQVSGSSSSALLFSSGGLLDPETVADLVVGVLDRPRLVVAHPFGRGVLARLTAPFPGLVLKALRQFRSIGERHRRRRAG